MILKMVKAKGSKQTVQETNDSSILSKASIAEHGYFSDPYLKLFCSRVVRRSPLIQRGYYIRAKAIDCILKTFLQHFQCRHTQIVSLGAGFDASYFRLKSSNLLLTSTYYDIDFPDVINRKQNIIQKQTALQNIIGEYVIHEQRLQSSDYCTLPCDITDLTKLENMLVNTNIDFSIPTLFFSECALTYVEYEESKELCKWIQGKFPSVSVMLYEQVNPSDAFGHVMVRHFEKIQSPLKRMHQLYNISKQKSLFSELCYSATVGFDMNSFYDNCIDVKEKCRLEKLEVFDEFEEWHLKCSHYCVVGAFQGDCVGLASKFIDNHPHAEVSTPHQVALVRDNPFNVKISQLQRFGHSCTKLNDNSYLCTGGFGVTSENRHDKLDDGFILSFCQSDSSPYGKKVEFELMEMDMKNMYHSMTTISDNMVFVFGGRTSPKQPKTEYGLYEIEDFMLVSHETYKLKLDGVDDYGVLQPIPRWRHSAVKIGDRIYISGGRSINNMALNDLWSFRLSSKIWKLEYLGEPLKPCHTHTMDMWNSSLVMFGGISNHQVVLDQLTIITFEDSNHKMEEITFEKIAPRYSHSSHISNDYLYIIGGIDPSCDTQPPILIISLVDKTWRSVHLPVCDPTRLLMLHNHCSVLLDENTIAIIGGGGNCFSFGSYFNPNLTVLDISEGTDVK